MIRHESKDMLNESQFVTIANELRKANRSKWVAWLGIVNGKNVRLKFFDLYTQILDVEGVRHGGTSSKSVTDWIDDLRKPFEG